MARKAVRPIDDQVAAVLTWLKRRGSKRNRDGMARYAITSGKVFGVSIATLQPLARRLGRNHELAEALWATGWYEARLLAAFVEEPARVTSAQMDRWCRAFDNWAICDTTCMHLFDRTPHAWAKVALWSRHRDEFVKRAAFALLASLAAHDRHSGDRPFARVLPLVEREAADGRNFVRKAVNWALRTIGSRSVALNTAATAVAKRLTESPHASARWVGKDALRQFASPAAVKRLAARSRKAAT